MTTTAPTPAQVRARAMLTRAIENLERYRPGTYGHRDAIHRDLPLAIEAMIAAGIEARCQTPKESGS